jgi:hypothetical protein
MRMFVLGTCLFLSGCHAEDEIALPSPTPEPALASPIPTPAAASPTPPLPLSSPVPASPTPTFPLTSPTPEPPTDASSTPTPTSTPEETATQNKAANSVPEKITYEGTWTTTDTQGQVFDIVIFQNGQAVTNWTKGPTGARGERGYWRNDERRLTVVYSDGCTDIIEPAANGFLHRRYPAGSPLDAKPIVEAETRRVEDGREALVGVWRLNKEPDGSHLYIALQSNGTAVSTINGATDGKWKANEKGALCEWPDGWVDQIERASGGWQKRSWVGAETSAPADLSPATRVGETRFAIEP